MAILDLLIAAVCGVILFLFAIENFSREVQRVSGERFRRFIAKGTAHPALGLGMGAAVTSVIQSSTATSVIAVGLVNAGILTFKSSLGIIFGANIGTTVTAQLVAFKLTNIAPYFIILGFALSLVRVRYSFIGKPIFFFGFVFFSLNFISDAVAPLQDDPAILSFLANAKSPLTGVLMGAAVTAIVQSSSVTTGLTVVLLQNGLVDFEAALPIIIGANVGTTVTALLASMRMDTAARRTAVSHFLYNLGGTTLFFPALLFIPEYVSSFDTSPAVMLANVHLVFNVATAFIFLLLISPFARLLEHLLPTRNDEFLKPLSFPNITDEPAKKGLDFLEVNIWHTLETLQHNYNLVTLALESKEESLLKQCAKNQSYLHYLESETQDFVSQLSKALKREAQIHDLVHKVSRIEYLNQISDSINNLVRMTEKVFERRISFSMDTILGFRELSGAMLKTFDTLQGSVIEPKKKKGKGKFGKALTDYHQAVEDVYRILLENKHEEGSGFSQLSRFLSLNQRIKDKLNSFFRLTRNEAGSHPILDPQP